MRRLAASIALVSLFGIAQVGCVASTDSASDEEGAVGTQSDAIIGGTPDSGHKAVVWLYDNDGKSCTGTVIATSPPYGYVLTAAHCGGMKIVAFTDDYTECFQSGCEYYDVDADQAHPGYDTSTMANDFRMLRFTGATASTPVIPAAQSPDGLAVGSSIELVGFGKTETDPDNSLRRHVMDTVEELVTLQLSYGQTDGTGACNGDSGGPALAGGKVVGVTSFGDQGCAQYGVSGRVQAVYDSFIAPFIGAGPSTPPPTGDCNSCFDASMQQGGACAGALAACQQSPACLDLANCVNACADDACVNGCAQQFAGGVDALNAVLSCGCQACANECASECAGSGGPTGGPTTPGAGGGDPGTGSTVGGEEPSTGKSKKKKHHDDDEQPSGCSASGATGGGASSYGAFVGLALALAATRRRRSAR